MFFIRSDDYYFYYLKPDLNSCYWFSFIFLDSLVNKKIYTIYLYIINNNYIIFVK